MILYSSITRWAAPWSTRLGPLIEEAGGTNNCHGNCDAWLHPSLPGLFLPRIPAGCGSWLVARGSTPCLAHDGHVPRELARCMVLAEVL